MKKTKEEILGSVVGMISLKDVISAVGDKNIITPNETLKAMDEYLNQEIVQNNELLIEMLTEISKWVKQDNQFMPLEYLGMLKEWLNTRIK